MKKRILIVDDQQLIRWVLRLALRDHFLVDEAEHAGAAWAQIATRGQDGIVLDVQMAESQNGIEPCERIKSDLALATINVVLVKPLSPRTLPAHFCSALSSARTDEADLQSELRGHA